MLFSAIYNAYVIVPMRLIGIEGHLVIADDLIKSQPGLPMSFYHSDHLIKTFEAQSFLFVYEPVKRSPCNYERIKEGINGCSTIVLKTFSEMEGPYIDFMKTQLRKPFILTGLLVPKPVSGELDEKCVSALVFPSH